MIRHLLGSLESHVPGGSKMSNGSSLNEFLLLAFADTRELQLLHFSLFLGIYLAALLGNSLIVTAVAFNHRLHNPMYFFLLNLSFLDLGSISTTLHYGTLLGSRACVKMAAAAWTSAFLNALLHTAHTFSIPLCQGNIVEQFFCEIPQILKLSCSDALLREVGLLVVSACLAFGCFIFIVVSYVQIFTAVLRIPSEQGRHKAFSMCLPHLAVVSLFVSTSFFAYLKPPSLSSPSLDLVVTVLYSVVPPTLNPLIYSMRNREIKDALKKLVQWTANTFSTPLCQGNTVDQFFCEIPQILKLSCSDAYLIEVGLIVGQHKAFSMCLPHLAMVSLFVSTSFCAYLKPLSISVPALDLVVAVLYSVVPPAVNPLIYSMRNKELKEALRKMISWILFSSGNIAIALHK
ncbi:olfactory receptor 14A16-like [Dromaius novaehollandiae]|uniref:olfactory receptor 14A16-like n=1 Tax=Dromaius novaehollandiae TaxID=8790 RepID=UPI00311F76BF